MLYTPMPRPGIRLSVLTTSAFPCYKATTRNTIIRQDHKITNTFFKMFFVFRILLNYVMHLRDFQQYLLGS